MASTLKASLGRAVGAGIVQATNKRLLSTEVLWQSPLTQTSGLHRRTPAVPGGPTGSPREAAHRKGDIHEGGGFGDGEGDG